MGEWHPTATGRRDPQLNFELELGRRRKGHGWPTSPAERTGDLSVCPCCRRDLVYPLDWASTGKQVWIVTLRCPECEWRTFGVYPQAVVDRFDEALDDATQAVLDDLELLTRANAEDAIDRFAQALAAGLVLPEDF